MIMDILGDKLVAANLGTKAKSIFNHQMPAEVNVGVFFRYPLTGVTIDPYIPGWYKARVQVIVRHNSVTEGEKFSYRVNEVLQVEGEEIYVDAEAKTTTRLMRFFPETLPVRYPRLEGNQIEWSTHFDAVFSQEKDK